MRLPVLPAAVTTLIAALVLTACGAFDASKSGGGVPPIAVRLATAEALGRAAADEVETFAREIENRSAGAISVEILWESYLGDDAGDPIAQNAYEGDPYAEVAAQVESGEVELALVPDFVWVERGAPAVAALKVPFLIDSVDIMNEVARRHGAESLAGLATLGITPLALLPESIRHPVGFDHPLLSPSDFQDRGIRVIDSSANAILTAWGARPVSLHGTFGKAVAEGEVSGADSAYVQAATLPQSGVFTADVSYTAKFNTLVASSTWWDALPPPARDVVTSAAAQTLEHSLATTEDDDEAGQAYCDRGGTIVHAGPERLDELRAAVQPIIDGLRADAGTRDLVGAIDAIRASSPAAVVAAECSPLPPPQLTGNPEETAAFPEGTFRAELTVEDFTDRGVDLGEANNHAQVWTLTFRDGQVWDIECPGTSYAVQDGRVSIVLGRGDPGCGTIPGLELFSARWTFDGHVLRFLDIGPGASGPAMQTFSEVLWGSQDWVKIG